MSSIKLFESKQIRSVWSEDDQKWYFSVIDVVAALTDSQNSRDYWYRIKQREKISGIELSTICRQFKLEAPDGKWRETDCSHTEGLLRIIQSIPSPKAEPFKRWLAKVGYERLEEIENPELAAKRMRELYKAKGYSDEWREDAKEKKATMKNYWLPGVNNLRTYSHWAFAEFADVYEMEIHFAQKIEAEFNKMIERITHEN